MRYAFVTILVFCIAMTVTSAATLLCQTTSPPRRFEVISIKPAKPTNDSGSLNAPGGRLIATNITLRPIIKLAFRPIEAQLLDDQIVGAPGWIDSDKFDIEAKPEGDARPTPRAQLQPMVQALLEDRFQLKMHRENRELPVYNLVVAKGGLKIKLSEDQTPPKPAAVPDSGPLPRGGYVSSEDNSGAAISANAIPISTLIVLIQTRLGRHIVDKTALTGLYDFNLKFSRDVSVVLPDAPAGTNNNGAADPTSPALFTAIQEQLGLRLESAKGPIEVIVIDSIEKPSMN